MEGKLEQTKADQDDGSDQQNSSQKRIRSDSSQSDLEADQRSSNESSLPLSDASKNVIGAGMMFVEQPRWISTKQLREWMQDRSDGTAAAVRHPEFRTRASLSVEIQRGTDRQAIGEIVEQTKGIRHAIDTLRDDVLRLNGSRQHDAVNDASRLSQQERAVLRFAAENLIQAIMSTRDESKLTVTRK